MSLSCENKDTKELLKYCDSGCKTATNSIEQVMEYAKSKELRKLLLEYDKKHTQLGDKCHVLLNRYHEEEEDPSFMVRTMSYVTTEMKMLISNEEKEIAKVMMDGCNMGIQSLGKYLNQFKKATGECRKIAEDLIDIEFSFMKDLRAYL